MQGRKKVVRELIFDPEIEKTAKANRKAVRLAHQTALLTSGTDEILEEEVPSSNTSNDETESMAGVDPPPRRTLGDYVQATGGHNPNLARFYEACGYTDPPGVTESNKKLRLFPLSLTGRAKDWIDTLPPNTITSWDELQLKFRERYFPIHKFLERRNDITNFEQGDSESLYDAWERFKLCLKKCPTHGLDNHAQMQHFTQGLRAQTRMLLDASAGGSLKNKDESEARELVEAMAQNEYRVQNDRGAKKKVGMLELDTLTALLAQSQLMNTQMAAIGLKDEGVNKSEGEVEKEWEIVAESDKERDEEVEKQSEKLVEQKKGKSVAVQEDKKKKEKSIHAKLPYPRKKKAKEDDPTQFKKFMKILYSFQMNIPFAEALEQMPVYAKFMKELLSKKRKPLDDDIVNMTEECSAIIQKKLPQKKKDPGSFTIPCSIGNLHVRRALCDLGASINLMPLSMMKRIPGAVAKPTKMQLSLADRSITHPYGILQNVLVRCAEFVFPADFVILDMEEDAEVPLLLGRPFLATGRTLIDVEKGELMFRLDDEQICFQVFEATTFGGPVPECFKVDVLEEVGTLLAEELKKDDDALVWNADGVNSVFCLHNKPTEEAFKMGMDAYLEGANLKYSTLMRVSDVKPRDVKQARDL
ncbi:hypothetical protein TSUD_296450 [Trifolium subterraneum]|uniref:Retrotransposon gag domain-containing protein n=1 Tax=Trifolium subterraneum TaxID=3900 RepID=A0A2Z6MHE1_TRISU|nr:hypothetical protein TSUD_296450 [Trifolium subterraneum]